MASDIDTATPEPGSRPFVVRLRAAFEHLAALWHWPAARSVPVAAPGAAAELAPPTLLRRPRRERRYSPLTRRILLLNIVPVALLALGAVYLSDYEDELIDSELASLLVQGEMMAAGIGEMAVVGGETTVNRLDAEAGRQLLLRLVQPTGVRARLFSETGELLGDTALLNEVGRIHVVPLPPPETEAPPDISLFDSLSDWLGRQISRSDRYPEYLDHASPTSRDFPEAASALRGFNASAVRQLPGRRLMLSVAVPVQRYKQVLGALVLSRDNRSVAASLREVRTDMLIMAAAALGITVLFSLYLASTITQPVARLARAAEGHLFALLVDYADLVVLADRASLGPHDHLRVVVRPRVVQQALGHAIYLLQRGAECRSDPHGERRVHHRAADLHQLQAAQIMPGRRRRLHPALGDGRHERGHRDPLPLDHRERHLRLRRAQQHDTTAVAERAEDTRRAEREVSWAQNCCRNFLQTPRPFIAFRQ